jgi:prepilin-type N-terminal cleavage/methylation domain
MNALRPSLRGIRGFTLIELLTVIAIIGILAAIIIPVVGRVRDTANGASCASNLRQLAMAVELYTQERGHYPPSVSGGSNTPNDGPSGRIWPQNLRPYMGAINIVNNGQTQMNSKLILCPGRGLKQADDSTDIVTSYSANPNVMPAMDGTVNAGNQLQRPAKFKNPSQIILMGDGVQRPLDPHKGAAYTNLWGISQVYTAPQSSADTPIPTPDVKDGDDMATFAYRHGSNRITNVVFLDGHVKGMSKGEILYRHLRNY